MIDSKVMIKKSSYERSQSVYLPNGISVMELKQMTAKRIADTHLAPGRGRSKSTSPKPDKSTTRNWLYSSNSVRSSNDKKALIAQPRDKNGMSNYTEAIHGLTVKELKNLTSLRLAMEEKGTLSSTIYPVSTETQKSLSSASSSPNQLDYTSPQLKSVEFFPYSPSYNSLPISPLAHTKEISGPFSSDADSNVKTVINENSLKQKNLWQPSSGAAGRTHHIETKISEETNKPLLSIDLMTLSPQRNFILTKGPQSYSPVIEDSRWKWNPPSATSESFCSKDSQYEPTLRPRLTYATNIARNQNESSSCELDLKSRTISDLMNGNNHCESFPLKYEDDISLQVAESVLSADAAFGWNSFSPNESHLDPNKSWETTLTEAGFSLSSVGSEYLYADSNYVIQPISPEHLEIISNSGEEEQEENSSDQAIPWSFLRPDSSKVTPIGVTRMINTGVCNEGSPCSSLFRIGFDWNREKYFFPVESSVLSNS